MTDSARRHHLTRALGHLEHWLELPPAERVAHARLSDQVPWLLAHPGVTTGELRTLLAADASLWAPIACHRLLAHDDRLCRSVLARAPADAADRLVDHLARAATATLSVGWPRPTELALGVQRLLAAALPGWIATADDHARHLHEARVTLDTRALRPHAQRLLHLAGTITPPPRHQVTAAAALRDQFHRLPVDCLHDQLPAWLLAVLLGRDDLPPGLRRALLERHLLRPLANPSLLAVPATFAELATDVADLLDAQELGRLADVLLELDLGVHHRRLLDHVLVPSGRAPQRDGASSMPVRRLRRCHRRGQLTAAAAGAAARRDDIDHHLRLELLDHPSIAADDLRAALAVLVEQPTRDPRIDQRLATLGQTGLVTDDPAHRQAWRVEQRLLDAALDRLDPEPCPQLAWLTAPRLLAAAMVLLDPDPATLEQRFSGRGGPGWANLLTAADVDPAELLDLPLGVAMAWARHWPPAARHLHHQLVRLDDAELDTFHGLLDDWSGSTSDLLATARAVTPASRARASTSTVLPHGAVRRLEEVDHGP